MQEGGTSNLPHVGVQAARGGQEAAGVVGISYQDPDQGRIRVELQEDVLVVGTKPHRIPHGDCISQGQSPGRGSEYCDLWQ